MSPPLLTDDTLKDTMPKEKPLQVRKPLQYEIGPDPSTSEIVSSEV